MMSHLPEAIRNILNEKRKITLEEYLQLPETNIHTELIDGVLYVYDGRDGNMAAPTVLHQRVSMRITLFLARFLENTGLYNAPIDLVLGGDVIQPDILWIAPDNTQCKEIDGCLYGAPDLVVEILSPSTHAKDRGVKFDLYDRYGVREYWIVDPQEENVEIYKRTDKMLHRQGSYELGKTFTSPILNNASIEVSALLG